MELWIVADLGIFYAPDLSLFLFPPCLQPPPDGRLSSRLSQTNTLQGRGHYEDEVIQNADASSSRSSQQQYNDRGYPRNPETKRQEREHVRAANEVMQVTGVVEDSLAAKAKANQYMDDKNQETFTGLRLMEAGRAVLVGGVWGVLGLRRRILVPISSTLPTRADILSSTSHTPRLDSCV